MFSYRRWRHTRGYGVHSPFAFTLVSDIIRLPSRYAYYGYSAIDRELTREGRGNDALNYKNIHKAGKEARLFLRLVAFLRPRTLYLPSSEENKLLRIAAQQSDSHLKIFTSPHNIKKCRMVCSAPGDLPLDILTDHILQPRSILLLKGYDRQTLDTLFDALPQGLMLHSPNNAIIINRPGMMKLSYSVNL